MSQIHYNNTRSLECKLVSLKKKNHTFEVVAVIVAEIKVACGGRRTARWTLQAADSPTRRVASIGPGNSTYWSHALENKIMLSSSARTSSEACFKGASDRCS